MNLSSVCIMDLDKPNLVCWFGFRLEPASTNDTANSKDVNNNHFATFTKVTSKSLKQSVAR